MKFSKINDLTRVFNTSGVENIIHQVKLNGLVRDISGGQAHILIGTNKVYASVPPAMKCCISFSIVRRQVKKFHKIL